MYYQHAISYNNLTYSVDMIRLKTYIDFTLWNNLDFYLNTYHKDNIKEFWIGCGISQFHYNYNIKVGDNASFWFGFQHNSETIDKHGGLFNFTIEFNPNKIKDNDLLLYILNLSGKWFIKNYDLAIDMKCNILDLIIDKGLKRELKTFSYGKDNITYMLGKGDCRLKIYNKKIESKLDIQEDLTRIEISRILEDYPISDIKFLNFGLDKFPEIYLNDYLYSFSDMQDKTLLALIFAVQNGFPINNLTRRYKEKIKNLFEGGQKIKFTEKEATEVLRKTVFAYFKNNNKVRWK